MEKKNTEKKKKTNAFTEMPHSLDNERALLGCILMDARIQVEVSGNLKEEDFYFDRHRVIFKAMDAILAASKPLDLVILIDALEKEGTLEVAGGVDYVVGLSEVLPSAANYESYLRLIKRDSTKRKLMRSALDIIDACNTNIDREEAITYAEDEIYKISEVADTGEMVKVDRVLPTVMATLDELAKDKNASKGIKTGYRGLDNLLNGFQPSNLIYLAARPSVGKTSLAMNVVENVARSGHSCAFFSLEMNKEELTQRLLCSIADVSMENAVKGRMNKTEWMKIAKAKQIMTELNIFINESAVTTTREILSQCKRLKAKSALDLVVIDYIQLMSPGKRFENRQQEVTEISRHLKLMAKELKVPVLALSQLSRAVETRKGRPQLSDLRESGSLEQDADIVMFIHRPDKFAKAEEKAKENIQENVAELLIEKNRHGPTGMVKLYFKGECTKFINLDESGAPEGEPLKVSAAPKLEGVEALPADATEQGDDIF